MQTSKTCVVMSTYNGEHYISTQLDSILNQKEVDIVIYVRDDGSTDGTPSILRKYASNYPNIIVSFETNVGFRKSFLKALKDAPDCEYYSFCDQDDYWFDNKLQSTIALLKNNNASLAFGNAIITDEKLVGEKLLYTKNSISFFPESLYSSNAHGFLFCFDKRIRDLAIRYPIDQFDIPHDFWLISVSDLFGKTINDLELVVAKYRRLPDSLSKRKPIRLFFNRIEAVFVDRGIVEKYSKNLLTYYSDVLSGDNKELVYSCANYRNNWESKKNLLKNKNIKLKHKIKVLFNKL